MDKEKKTQREEVVRHLEDYGCITSLEAFKEYGITRLSAIIWSLRHKFGYRIINEPYSTINRYGDSVRFANYTLEGKDEDL